jgi:stage III sporulation protein AA
VDEVTAEEDLYAMTAAANCGVSLLATIHAESVAELMRKPLYANLLQAGVFRMAVRLRKEGGTHLREVEELPC